MAFKEKIYSKKINIVGCFRHKHNLSFNSGSQGVVMWMSPQTALGMTSVSGEARSIVLTDGSHSARRRPRFLTRLGVLWVIKCKPCTGA